MYLQVDVPMARPPVANWVLIAVTAVVSIKVMVDDAKAYRHYASVLASDSAPDPRLNNPRLTEKQRQKIEAEHHQRRMERLDQLPLPPSLRLALHPDWESFRVWQLITYQFVHADVIHLIGNMIFLFGFGNAVNAKLGHGLYVLLYLALGAFAGLSYAFLESGAPLVGASGAISGITGLFLVLYPLNEIAVWTVRSLIWTGDAWRFPSWVFILFYFVWDLFGTLKLTGESGIAYVCHLGGSLLGIALAWGMVIAGWVRSDRGEQTLPELWGWVERRPRRKRKKRRPQLPPANSERESEP
jgi:membrane associated rhomboid family serine protease